jgi:hypothetical protein
MIGQKNRETLKRDIFFFWPYSYTHDTGTQGFSQDFETISHFCGTDFFFKL